MGKIDVDSLCAKVENQLRQFDQTRENYEKEILKVRDDVKESIDKLFEQLVKEYNPIVEETDTIVDELLKDFRNMVDRQKKLESRISPVLDIIKKEMVDESNF